MASPNKTRQNETENICRRIQGKSVTRPGFMRCCKMQVLHYVQQELYDKKLKVNSTFRLKGHIFGGLECVLRFKNKGPIFEGRGL